MNPAIKVRHILPTMRTTAYGIGRLAIPADFRGVHRARLNLVEITKPICRMIDPKKSDYLLYDTTGIEANVKENNPKFLSSKLTSAKKAAKNNPDLRPY